MPRLATSFLALTLLLAGCQRGESQEALEQRMAEACESWAMTHFREEAMEWHDQSHPGKESVVATRIRRWYEDAPYYSVYWRFLKEGVDVDSVGFCNVTVNDDATLTIAPPYSVERFPPRRD